MKTIKTLLNPFLAVICALFLTGADYLGQKQIDRYENVHGTVFQIVIFDDTYPREKLWRVTDAAFRIIEQVEGSLNSEADNVLDKINQGRKGDSFQLDADTFFVIKEAQWISKITKSAVDLTDEPLKKIWLEAKEFGEPPSQDVIDSALPKVNAQYILLNSTGKTLVLQKDFVRLDLNEEAKAYAVDKAAAYLRSEGIQSALVRGDNVTRFVGAPREAAVWRLGIEHPRKIDEYAGIMEVAEEASVATVSDYDDFFIYKNRRYPMVIHPKTGQPAQEGVASVTVMASSALIADLLSRAFFVMKPEESYDLAEALKERGVEAVVIEEQPNKKFTFSSSEGARMMIKDILL